MTNFFEAVKNLFPLSRAFGLAADNNKRKLMEALSVLPDDVRSESEKVYSDTFPESTRFPGMWEETFALYLTKEEYSKRRAIIGALWKTISGNQSTEFLQSILRVIDPGIFVYENVPLTDPRNKESVGLAVCDYPLMVCDGAVAICDYMAGDPNFTPGVIQNDVSGLYDIPDDTRFWETCFFVCGEIFRNDYDGNILYIAPIEIPRVWKNIIELLILKIKPVQMTAVTFIQWTDPETEEGT